jgi:hypothetical protein
MQRLGFFFFIFFAFTLKSNNALQEEEPQIKQDKNFDDPHVSKRNIIIKGLSGGFALLALSFYWRFFQVTEKIDQATIPSSIIFSKQSWDERSNIMWAMNPNGDLFDLKTGNKTERLIIDLMFSETQRLSFESFQPIFSQKNNGRINFLFDPFGRYVVVVISNWNHQCPSDQSEPLAFFIPYCFGQNQKKDSIWTFIEKIITTLTSNGILFDPQKPLFKNDDLPAFLQTIKVIQGELTKYLENKNPKSQGLKWKSFLNVFFALRGYDVLTIKLTDEDLKR